VRRYIGAQRGPDGDASRLHFIAAELVRNLAISTQMQKLSFEATKISNEEMRK
jgi:hypothetical protein